MIKIENISKYFNGTIVLEDISTHFERGKTNLIIGQSGSGKTVLLKEVANAIARRQSVKDLAYEVHTHPTLSEVVEIAYKQASKQLED